MSHQLDKDRIFTFDHQLGDIAADIIIQHNLSLNIRVRRQKCLCAFAALFLIRRQNDTEANRQFVFEHIFH